MLGCLLFALAGGFIARQISLTRVEELARLEAQAITPAPTPTRVLSAEERAYLDAHADRDRHADGYAYGNGYGNVACNNNNGWNKS